MQPFYGRTFCTATILEDYKRRHTETEVSKNSFRLNDLKASGNTVETFIHRFRMDLIFVWGKAKNCALLSFLSVLD